VPTAFFLRPGLCPAIARSTIANSCSRAVRSSFPLSTAGFRRASADEQRQRPQSPWMLETSRASQQTIKKPWLSLKNSFHRDRQRFKFRDKENTHIQTYYGRRERTLMKRLRQGPVLHKAHQIVVPRRSTIAQSMRPQLSSALAAATFWVGLFFGLVGASSRQTKHRRLDSREAVPC
jgi:hypothetical protein